MREVASQARATPVVTVADHGVDACLVEREGKTPLLILRPTPSFGAAVAAVSMVLPWMGQDEVRRIVRQYLPDAMDLEEFLIETEPAAPPRAAYPMKMGAASIALALIGFGLIQAEATRENHELWTDRLEQVRGLK